ncbi:hypothetical protein [Streptomyces carpinensis]|uniref:Uncharacterized protein n=1 Tax=Streptomyces carpinensis TaxID=66369 RepID=A0ABV1W7U2_9ACTN|nr:hypothetical protein [Streptomyces carpinensis]
MRTTPRGPYEDCLLRFDRHARRYGAVDPVRQAVDEGEARLLGDPERLGRAVAHLAGGKPPGPTARRGGWWPRP